MKKVLVIGFLTVFFNLLGLSAAIAQVPNQQPSADKKTLVLVELFTSQGCPICPPADANLAFLEKEQPFLQAEVITLSLHVDYWNSSVWKDEFSSPMFSRRQQIYSQALRLDSNYTPQMIVDGQKQFIGNNMAKAQKAILEAAKIQKAIVEITSAADKFKIKISDVPAHETATVFLAITEDSPASNRKLEQTSVVRTLSSLGMLTAQQTSLELETALQIQPAWKKENLKVIVFVQENASRKILGVGRKPV